MRSSEDKAGRERRKNEKKRDISSAKTDFKMYIIYMYVCYIETDRRFFFNKHIECAKETKKNVLYV
jgi:hypothetical protein